MQDRLKNIKFKSPPLLSWDAFSLGFYQQSLKLKKQQEIEELAALASKYNWKTNLMGLLERNYDALVLTDTDATIKWVNKGFFTMTGYPKSFSIGKKPNFLQGEKTIRPKLNNILNDLGTDNSFSTTLINYRRNKESYLCNIEIFPLYDEDENLSHLLAIEKEITDKREKDSYHY